MGKKYIIELVDRYNSEFKGIIVLGLTQEKQISVELIPKKSMTPYTEPEPHAEVTADAYQRGYETAKHECEDCPKQAYTDALKMESYQKGLNDAWEAARKICTNWVLPDSVLSEIFGMGKTIDDIMKENTASEVIAKIRAYEQEKEEKIQVGDEVIATSGKAVIVGINADKDKARYIYPDSTLGFDNICNLSKTGRHFPEIAEVLQKMKETDNG